MNAGLQVSQKGTKISVKWGKVSKATGYKVYIAYCGKKFVAPVLIEGSKNVSTTISKIDGKTLDLKKNFKVYVVAYTAVNGKDVVLAKTITAHIVGQKNTKYTNPKSLSVSKSSYSLSLGKKVQIKAKTKLVDSKKKSLTDAHAKEFRYASTDKKVATVSSTGVIKAVGKGTCYIYVYARNGYAKKVKVTVK